MGIVICSHCGIRAATRLCDMPIGKTRYIGHPPRHIMEMAKSYSNAWVKVEMERTVTCDRPICKECATQVAADIDFCPTCMERIRTTPTRYRRRH